MSKEPEKPNNSADEAADISVNEAAEVSAQQTAIDASTFQPSQYETNFAEQLQSISEALSHRDLDSLKFLFYDNIPHDQDHIIQTGIDLFSLIQKMFPFGDFIPRLAECLNLIDRNDLVSLLRVNPDNVRRDLRQNIHFISDYRLFLYRIAESLGAHELKALKKGPCYWMTDIQKNRIISLHAFLVTMEKGGKLSPCDFSLLSQLLLELQREDLVTRIRDAPAFHAAPSKRQTDSSRLGSPTKLPTTLTQHDKKQEAVSTERDKLDVLDEEFIERVRNIKMEQVQDLDDMPRYSMDASCSGVCLIINNETFSKTSHLEDRPGSSLDVVNLTRTFNELSFHTITRHNLTTPQLIQCLAQCARIDHSQFDAFVCCILTHGKPNQVHGIDGKLIDIMKLTRLFVPDNCPSLTGKPKMFFIQACRGIGKQTEATIQVDGNDGAQQGSVPQFADFLYGYATVYDHVSYRYTEQGSWYIFTLTSLLNRYAHRHDLLTILTRVNEEVARGVAFSEYKQVPAPVTTLRKKVMFKKRTPVSA